MQRHFGDLVDVYDADYAISDTERKFLTSQASSDAGRPHVLHVDALNRQDLIDSSPSGGWDILVDKSTADAIACGEPVTVALGDGSAPKTAEPIEVLCRNLHRVTSEGATWLCISYSSSRFDFLAGAGKQHGWRVRSKAPVSLTESAQTEAVVHRPETGTWGWVLERV